MLAVLSVALQSGQIDPLASTRVILALVCVIVASSLALGIAVGLARRIQEIAGPEPREAQDEEEPRTES